MTASARAWETIIENAKLENNDKYKMLKRLSNSITD
jgi:hypothetical protein